MLAITAETLITSKSAFVEGVGHFGLSIRLKGYIYRQYLYTVR